MKAQAAKAAVAVEPLAGMVGRLLVRNLLEFIHRDLAIIVGVHLLEHFVDLLRRPIPVPGVLPEVRHFISFDEAALILVHGLEHDAEQTRTCTRATRRATAARR